MVCPLCLKNRLWLAHVTKPVLSPGGQKGALCSMQPFEEAGDTAVWGLMGHLDPHRSRRTSQLPEEMG